MTPIEAKPPRGEKKRNNLIYVTMVLHPVQSCDVLAIRFTSGKLVSWALL